MDKQPFINIHMEGTIYNTGLHRSLIDFDPLVYVLGRRKSHIQSLSHPLFQL